MKARLITILTTVILFINNAYCYAGSRSRLQGMHDHLASKNDSPVLIYSLIGFAVVLVLVLVIVAAKKKKK